VGGILNLALTVYQQASLCFAQLSNLDTLPAVFSGMVQQGIFENQRTSWLNTQVAIPGHSQATAHSELAIGFDDQAAFEIFGSSPDYCITDNKWLPCW
jgi:hypothetical protein